MDAILSGSGRRVLEHISVRAFEHPADRAALGALRALPGFSIVLRALFGLVGDRSVRYLHLANAVQVSDKQLSRVDSIYRECLEVLDVERRPELFVLHTPVVNAGALGVDNPFIVLHSASLQLFDDDELRFVLGHELGHVLSGHALYKTTLGLLLRLSFGYLGLPIASVALLGVVAALREWDRKSELSADRAGLLAAQCPDVAYRVHMKLAGGIAAREMNVEAFVAQAADYQRAGGVLDGVLKLVNLLQRTHPFGVVRLAELKRWVDSGDYERVLSGDYVRRSDDESAPLGKELLEGIRSYQQTYRQSTDPLARFVQELAQASGSVLDRALDRFRQR